MQCAMRNAQCVMRSAPTLNAQLTLALLMHMTRPVAIAKS